VSEEFGGPVWQRLIDEALQATRDAGLRIVAVCPMVAGFVAKHPEFADVANPVDADVKRWLATLSRTNPISSVAMTTQDRAPARRPAVACHRRSSSRWRCVRANSLARGPWVRRSAAWSPEASSATCSSATSAIPTSSPPG